MEYKYIECNCETAEHTIRFTNDPDITYPAIYVTFQLNPYVTFWKRLWFGIKYICGIRCLWGHWDEAVLSGKQIEELQKLCDEHLKAFDEFLKEE